jgi:peptide/nickel transport system ATP-binding protein
MMVCTVFYSVILSGMTQPLLSVENLSIKFITDGDATTAVRNISFKIDAGEILAIVGESGSGKSVTALSLMQLLPKQTNLKGNIFFSSRENEAVDLLKISSKKINGIRGKDMAMIFQEPMTSLNPVFTCGYQVMETIQLHQQISLKAAREKTIALFEKVHLPNPAEIIDRYPHQLSGGQKQRVMIAMAMSCSPSLLIADEPTTALDVTVQKTIMQLIKQLQQQTGMGVIFITHDLGLVAEIADRILVMYQGEIIEQGQTKDVLQHPRKPYTKALLACRPSMHAPGAILPVVRDFLDGKYKMKQPDLADSSSKKENTLTENDDKIVTLTVENLKVYYPGRKHFFKNKPEPFKAVDDVSFSVYKGETIGLVGESGCGKTTLGRAILQLVPTTSGSIILDGENLAALSKRQMRPFKKDLQIVFQDPYGSLNPRIMIGNAIMEPMRVNGVLNNGKQRRERVIEILEKVDLSADHFTRYPHQFSGGQRQRICIARALVLNPSFLIFDESVSALDVSVQAQILNLMNDLKKEFRFTSIFISHDLSVVRYISDRIIVMSNGKIVEEGPAEEIYSSPKNEYTKKLIDAIPGKPELF